MIANFTIFPVGKGESLSPYVAEIFRIIEVSGLQYQHHDMGTNIEGEWEEIAALVNKCRLKMLESAGRVYFTLTVDERAGKSGRLGTKVQSALGKMKGK